MLLLIICLSNFVVINTQNAGRDFTGLTGISLNSGLGDNRIQIPLKFWGDFNHDYSRIKPRKTDRDPHKLMKILDDSFEPAWMKLTKREDKILNITSGIEENVQRPGITKLWERALSLEKPIDFPTHPSVQNPSDNAAAIAPWLVALSTCQVKTEWKELGHYFWPRIIKRVECLRTKNNKNEFTSRSCGWPIGKLNCASGAIKQIHILRWHCRLRELTEEKFARYANQGIIRTPPTTKSQSRRKRREKYRCEWLKVPYTVPTDCICGGGQI